MKATGNAFGQTGTTAGLFFQFSRGSSPTLIGNVGTVGALSGAANTGSPPLLALDAPGTASSQAYTVYCKETGATGTFNGGTGTSTMTLEEIMGSMPDPANDNIDPGVFSATG